MATLLTNQTSDTLTLGSEHTGPATIHFSGTFDNATVYVEIAPTDTAAKYKQYGDESEVSEGKPINVNVYGTYFIRLRQRKSGASTSISAETTQ